MNTRKSLLINNLLPLLDAIDVGATSVVMRTKTHATVHITQAGKIWRIYLLLCERCIAVINLVIQSHTTVS
jgi:hypothetical protein